jgi:hypothetical protein
MQELHQGMFFQPFEFHSLNGNMKGKLFFLVSKYTLAPVYQGDRSYFDILQRLYSIRKEENEDFCKCD